MITMMKWKWTETLAILFEIKITFGSRRKFLEKIESTEKTNFGPMTQTKLSLGYKAGLFIYSFHCQDFEKV